MADGKIVVQAEVDAKNAQKELDKLTAKIDKMEAELKKSTGEQSGLKSQLDAAKESAKQAENALKSLLSGFGRSRPARCLRLRRLISQHTGGRRKSQHKSKSRKRS